MSFFDSEDTPTDATWSGRNLGPARAPTCLQANVEGFLAIRDRTIKLSVVSYIGSYFPGRCYAFKVESSTATAYFYASSIRDPSLKAHCWTVTTAGVPWGDYGRVESTYVVMEDFLADSFGKLRNAIELVTFNMRTKKMPVNYSAEWPIEIITRLCHEGYIPRSRYNAWAAYIQDHRLQ